MKSVQRPKASKCSSSLPSVTTSKMCRTLTWRPSSMFWWSRLTFVRSVGRPSNGGGELHDVRPPGNFGHDELDGRSPPQERWNG